MHDDEPVGANGGLGCDIYDVLFVLVKRRVALGVLRQNAGIDPTPFRPGPILDLLFLYERCRQPGDESYALIRDEVEVAFSHYSESAT